MSSIKNIFLIDDDADDRQFFIEALSGIENIKLFGAAGDCAQALSILNNTSSLT